MNFAVSGVNYIAVLEKTGNIGLSGWKQRIFVILNSMVEYYEAPESAKNNMDAFIDKLRSDVQKEPPGGHKRVFLIREMSHRGEFRIRDILNINAEEDEPRGETKGRLSESLIKKSKPSYIRIHVEVGDRTHHFRTVEPDVAVQFIRQLEARRRFISTGEVVRQSIL